MTHAHARCLGGFGLLELIIVTVVALLMAALAVPAYNGAIERGRIGTAIGQIEVLAAEIGTYNLNHQQLPAMLDILPVEIPLDPWGNEYQYTVIDAACLCAGNFRKEGNLIPLNSDFDLFSSGKDGDSAAPLAAPKSRDDIVRANNGAFIGLAEEY